MLYNIMEVDKDSRRFIADAFDLGEAEEIRWNAALSDKGKEYVIEKNTVFFAKKAGRIVFVAKSEEEVKEVLALLNIKEATIEKRDELTREDKMALALYFMEVEAKVMTALKAKEQELKKAEANEQAA